MSPGIPIAAVDPVQAAELAGRAAGWVADVARQRRNKRERNAAVLLRELGVCAASLHALNNAAREVTTPLLRYRDDWSGEERDRVFDAIDAFLNDLVVQPELERSAAGMADLARLWKRNEFALDDVVLDALRRGDDLDAFVEITNETHMAVEAHELTHGEALGEVWMALWYARRAEDPLQASAEAITRLAHLGHDLRQLVPRDWVLYTDDRVGRLRAVISASYPKMPVPEWLAGAPGPAAGPPPQPPEVRGGWMHHS